MDKLSEERLRTADLFYQYLYRRLRILPQDATQRQRTEARKWAEHIAPHTCCLEDAAAYLRGGAAAIEPVEPCVLELFQAADALALDYRQRTQENPQCSTAGPSTPATPDTMRT